jgi:hypothetical protein
MMFPTLKTHTAIAAGALLTCTNAKMASKLPDFSGIVVGTMDNQY